MPGVSRRLLDRVGGEVARATSVVRYAPGSLFSPHTHTGGEEFLVLEGVFQDEHGDYPTGSYIRNPPGSSHTPGSESGCIIFVKLWQFEPDDLTSICLNYRQLPEQASPLSKQVSIIPLFQNEFESVSIEHWPANAIMDRNLQNGAELFVLAGGFTDGDDSLKLHSWLRLPIASGLHLKAGPEGATVWIKQGHLRKVAEQIARLPDTL